MCLSNTSAKIMAARDGFESGLLDAHRSYIFLFIRCPDSVYDVFLFFILFGSVFSSVVIHCLAYIRVMCEFAYANKYIEMNEAKHSRQRSVQQERIN